MILYRDEKENTSCFQESAIEASGYQTENKYLVLGYLKLTRKLSLCFSGFMERTLLMSMGDWIQMESQQMLSMDRK